MVATHYIQLTKKGFLKMSIMFILLIIIIIILKIAQN